MVNKPALDTLLICFDPVQNNLIIGRRDFKTHNTKVVSTFQGQEAVDIYNKLIGGSHETSKESV